MTESVVSRGHFADGRVVSLSLSSIRAALRIAPRTWIHYLRNLLCLFMTWRSSIEIRGGGEILRRGRQQDPRAVFHPGSLDLKDLSVFLLHQADIARRIASGSDLSESPR